MTIHISFTYNVTAGDYSNFNDALESFKTWKKLSEVNTFWYRSIESSKNAESMVLSEIGKAAKTAKVSGNGFLQFGNRKPKNFEFLGAS